MRTATRCLRVAAYFLLLMLALIAMELALLTFGVVPTVVDRAGSQLRFNALVRRWGAFTTWLTLHLLDARLDVCGRTPPGRFIVVSNHQSTADVAILIATLSTLNCKFVAKRTLGWAIPMVSMALAHGGGALISRKASRRDVRELTRMAAALERWDGSAVVFAEGTRSRDGRLLPYRRAVARVIAEETGLPLLPVTIDGTHVASDLPSFAWRMTGARARVTIGEPIPVERYRGRLGETLQEIRAWTGRVIEADRRGGSVPPPSGWQPGTTLC